MENEDENTAQYVRLEELSNSDYEIKDGEPDIIGWNIKTIEGNKLGEVDELIFDPVSRKVRYLVLNMEDNEMSLEDERRVLIPIGIAELHSDDDDVILPGITTKQLRELPPYEGCPELTPTLEMQTRNVFEPGTGNNTMRYEHPKFYAHQHFDEDKFYSRSKLPDNGPIIPAEGTGVEEEAGRALKASRIVDRINHKDNHDKG